jgi:hypothetical protein
LISLSETISAGIRFRITSAIRIRGTTGVTIAIPVMVVAVVEVEGMVEIGVMTATARVNIKTGVA